MMDKKRIEIIITAVLVLIFVFALAGSIAKIRRRALPQQPAVSTAAVSPSQPSSPAPKPQATAVKKEEDKELLAWGKDPFSGKIYTSPAGKQISLKLEGILWDALKPQAIINNEVVREGDTVGGYKVIKINHDAVFVDDGTKDIELRLQ